MTLRHTAQVDRTELAAARELCFASFDPFGDEDWSHALGGEHALVHDGGSVVAHGAVVLRRLLVDGRWLRCGYVEAVAVDETHRGRGHGHTVMAALEALAPGYDLLGLCASQAGRPLYESRGWLRWRGPTSALTPDGVVATPDEDSIYVLGGAFDLDAPITCDWREGDLW
ncbi:GNAT family N-acetyltransferase [Nocardioides hankookensis]|uniref:GNAT family N-acetyltransferase n=1 Tax=Nocardioides hankookensis TaxID=443157 RepID=A0ABW1LHW8_9ACTN